MILPTVFLPTWRKVSLNVGLGEIVWKILLRQYYSIFICRSKYCLLWNINPFKAFKFFLMTGLVFPVLFYSITFGFGIKRVLGFLLIARDYLSVIYCEFMSRCMYYLTMKVLQLSADMNQENFYSLVYLYRTSGLVNVSLPLIFSYANCLMWQMKTVSSSLKNCWLLMLI